MMPRSLLVRYPRTMHFEWDESKNRSNQQRYGLDFTEAKRLFNPSLFVDIDDREECYVGLGTLDGHPLNQTDRYRSFW